MNDHALFDLVRDLPQLPGAHVLLICQPPSEPAHGIRFIDGRPHLLDLSSDAPSPHEPIVAIEADWSTLQAYLAGTVTLERAGKRLRIVSRDIGPVMVLSGILQSPLRH